MRVAAWRQARALLWVGMTLVLLLALFIFAGVVTIPGIPTPRVDLSSLGPWVYILPLLLATKALLEVLRPVFRAALRTHVRYEADIFAHFQIVSYVVWGTAFALVAYVLVENGGQDLAYLGTAFVVASAALIFVMQEPLLNLVGWLVLIAMGLYKLGDRIEMNQARGYVVDITPMNTTLREVGGLLYGDSFTGRYVTIPKLLLESAEDIVAPMMRENRAHLRSKYEFADLADYIAEEPKVGWGLGASSVDLTLVYFCPVFAKGAYRTRLVKRILEKFSGETRVAFAYPHMQMVPSADKKVSVVR
ncbi:MAG: mechanosensitive ion channel [Methanobacteriota archaeon]|nr:MAG: mechanosensitive ion channel [Euryarchaeota archaeon]